MSTDSNRSAGNSGTPEGASDAFRDFIEERYLEWDREFGEEVHQRRAVTIDVKPEA
jgi:hypothetical protein